MHSCRERLSLAESSLKFVYETKCALEQVKRSLVSLFGRHRYTPQEMELRPLKLQSGWNRDQIASVHKWYRGILNDRGGFQ